MRRSQARKREGEADSIRVSVEASQAPEGDGREVAKVRRAMPPTRGVIEATDDHGDDRRRSPPWIKGSGTRIAERRVVADRGREPQDPADQRRLGIVAAGESLAPEPVLRVVDEEVGGVERQERDPPEGDEGDADEAEPRSARLRPPAWWPWISQRLRA